MRIYNVPGEFRLPDQFRYPADNDPDFEHWFSQNLNPFDFSTERVYLPILFTSFFKRNKYGKDKNAIARLQAFVDTLPAGEKYFCVVQYDDGTIVDWKGKDVLVFGMSGKPEGCIPIPLVCQPHVYTFDVKRDIPFSFIGRVTDPARKVIIEWGSRKHEYYITDKHHPLMEYCKIMARSTYVLCPRGYGASSFRIAEALQYGAIPIILHDIKDVIFPCPASCIMDYDGNLNSLDLDDLVSHLSQRPYPHVSAYYQKYYSFDAVKRLIYNSLWDTL